MDWLDLFSKLSGVVLVVLIGIGMVNSFQTGGKLLQQIADNTARIADALEKKDTRERQSLPDGKQGV